MADNTLQKTIEARLNFIYKEKFDPNTTQKLVNSIELCKRNLKHKSETKWDEKDIILITYGDSIKKKAEKPLNTLNNFLEKYLKEQISFLHILPFFPYSSDDGFSVIDYNIVDPELGNWDDIEMLNKEYKLMSDLVINHISQHSIWYQNYLKGIKPGNNFFIEADPNTDLSQVVRPRSLPLLTKANTSAGEKYVWTTFSEDQIDLNFANPDLLVEMIKVFLLYIEKGARIIRLDAIAFLWKQIGTNCLHLPETHEVVKFLRDIIEHIDSNIILLTETNVPNKENLSYFGKGDEANMVYQFSLPPLLLHALHNSNSKYLTQWASGVTEIDPGCSFFNFTASHDGIGVRPLEGLVPIEEVDKLAKEMQEFGGLVNTKRNPDGSDSPYELNITYFDALKGTYKGEDKHQIERFICSQTIMMSLQGIPAFYIHSLLATKNYYKGVKETGMNRTINRRKWNADEIEKALSEKSNHALVLTELKRLIDIRKKVTAFHPEAKQQVLDISDDVFAFTRGEDELLALSNISPKEIILDISTFEKKASELTDLIGGDVLTASEIKLEPYQSMWLIN